MSIRCCVSCLLSNGGRLFVKENRDGRRFVWFLSSSEAKSAASVDREGVCKKVQRFHDKISSLVEIRSVRKHFVYSTRGPRINYLYFCGA